MRRLFGKLAADPPSPDVAAEGVWQAVNENGGRRRLRAGQDAHALPEDRKAKDDTRFMDGIRNLTGS